MANMADPARLAQLIPSSGIIRDYYGWVKDTTDASAHFHLFAAASLVGTALERRVMIWSEFDHAMAQFTKDYMAGTVQFFSKLYDCPERITRHLRKETWTIERPAVSILAASTPDSFARHG